MNSPIPIPFLKRRNPSTLLGLALDGSHLEGAVLRRSNGSLQILRQFNATLALDPLTNDAELVGREILNHLEAAGIREHHCVVALPLKWAMTAHTRIPDLPAADIPAFLGIEAERGFPTDVATLQVATSRLEAAGGSRYAAFIGIPRSHLERLESVLRAAKLKPASFSLGLAALQPPDSAGVLALTLSENEVGLQITSGGGIAALRALEGAVESEIGERALHADLVAREARITLGQLPADLRDPVKQIRIFGPRAPAARLADELRPRFEPGGIRVEIVGAYAADEFGRTIPPDTPVSAAFSLAARQLAGRTDDLEFLPPKVSAWQQLSARYASGRMRTAGLAAAGVLLVLLLSFGYQQWQLLRLRSRWNTMSARVLELEALQQRVRQYRPWFDESCRYLSILRQVTLAFPEEGSVTARTLEIRDATGLRENKDQRNVNTVSCTGTAQSYAALVKTVHQLGAIAGSTNFNFQTRGKAPMQFNFDFQVNGELPR